MKSLFLSVCLFSLFQANAAIYQCYKGTLSLQNGETKEVRIQKLARNPRRGNNYFFQVFTIGTESWETSGKAIEKNTLAFNSNDDYIPGGYACSNTDIQLDFKGKKARGTFYRYRFPNCAGTGGPRYGSEDFLVQKGTFKLKAYTCF